MSWELGVTELGDPECELVELGIVLPPESLSVSDALRHRSSFKRSVKESAPFSDALTLRGGFRRLLADSAAVLDSGLWRRAFRRFGESVALTDTNHRIWAAVRRLSESASAVDSFGRKWQAKPVLVEQSAVSDAASRIFNAKRAVADQNKVSEVVSRSFDAYRVFQESQGTADSRKMRAKRVLRDSGALSDSFSRILITHLVLQETQALDFAYKFRVRVKLEEAGQTSDHLRRVFDAHRLLAEKAGATDDRRMKVMSVRSDAIGLTDLVGRLADFRRLVAEPQKVVDADRKWIRMVKVDEQATEEGFRRFIRARRLDVLTLAEGYRRAWSAFRFVSYKQELAEDRRSRLMLVKEESQAVVDAGKRFRIMWRRVEEQGIEESRRMALSMLRNDVQPALDVWMSKPKIGVSERQAVADAFNKKPIVAAFDQLSGVDVIIKWVRPRKADVAELVDRFDRRWLAYRTVGESAAMGEWFGKLFEFAPFREAQGVEASISKRPKPLMVDGQRARDSVSRVFEAFRAFSDGSEPVDRLGRRWLAFRAYTDETGAEDVIAKIPRVRAEERQAVAISMRSVWSAFRGVKEAVRVREAGIRRRISILRRDEQQFVDRWGRRLSIYRRFVEVASMDDDFRRSIGASVSDAVGAVDLFSRAWASFRMFREATIAVERRFMRVSASRSDGVSVHDAIGKRSAIVRHDRLSASDSPVWRLVRKAFRDLVGSIDSVFRWDPTAIRRYGFRAWFALVGRTIGFVRSARTLPFEFVTRWEGERVLRMMMGEARVVRVRVEAADGEEFVISSASVEVFDERTNELVESGLADIDGDRVNYLFSPPGPGVYTLVFTMQVGPQVIKHRESVRVVQ